MSSESAQRVVGLVVVGFIISVVFGNVVFIIIIVEGCWLFVCSISLASSSGVCVITVVDPIINAISSFGTDVIVAVRIIIVVVFRIVVDDNINAAAGAPLVAGVVVIFGITFSCSVRLTSSRGTVIICLGRMMVVAF